MTDYNIFNDGRLTGTMYREGGQWYVDNGSDTEAVASIRETTALLKKRGYTVEPTAMGGLIQGGE